MFIPKAPVSNKEISDDDDETIRSLEGREKLLMMIFAKKILSVLERFYLMRNCERKVFKIPRNLESKIGF
jgi:hypothetical protein